jgi:MFS family permease
MATNARLAFQRAEDIPLHRRLLALGFICVGYFFYAWSWNTVDILRPYIAADLSLSLTQAGSMYSAQALGALFGSLINGQLADRFGRRNALMLVMIGYGICLLLGTVVQTYPQLLAQRAVMGYFMGTMFPITAGLYSILFAPEIRGRVASVVFGVYNIAVAALGAASSAIFAQGWDWHILLWVGVVPIAAAFLAPIFVPDDLRVAAWGDMNGDTRARTRLPIAELFVVRYRRQTLMLALLTGLNFFGYQAFTGWATTFLKDVRGVADAAVGVVIFWQFAGSIIGTFFWGWFGDKYGRRPAAIGFLLGAALILVFLFAPVGAAGLSIIAFVYGAVAACTVIWGPWLTELYPPHLKSTAASIFNWGRIISFMAPLITGKIAESYGLTATMTVASLTFALAAVVWLRLPETLNRPQQRAAD